MINLSRRENLTEKVVFVDGLPGCGKTLLSPLVSALDKVELLNYAFEIENFCVLNSLKKLPLDAAKVMIDLHTDLKLYNTMMSRDLNFRPTDISSAVKAHNFPLYIERLLSSGDESIPSKIRKEKPILNFAVHNMLGYSEPVWKAFGARAVLVEVVRHPLYMIRQQALNMKNLLCTPRDFNIYYSYNKYELPFYVRGWEDHYINSNSMERSVYFMKNATDHTNNIRKKVINTYQAKIITIPFEQFVLHPNPWMEKIAKAIGTEITDTTRKVMKEQNVPREMVAQGIDFDAYNRCGWVPPKDGSTERDEINIRREDVAREVSADVLAILDRLSNEYEEKYWNPDI